MFLFGKFPLLYLDEYLQFSLLSFRVPLWVEQVLLYHCPWLFVFPMLMRFNIVILNPHA